MYKDQQEHEKMLNIIITESAQLLSDIRLSDPKDCSPPGSSVHGISQAKILE